MLKHYCGGFPSNRSSSEMQLDKVQKRGETPQANMILAQKLT